MSKQLICSVCGHVDKAKTPIKGNGLIEIILWLSFIVPGIIYSIWRRSSLSPVCSACKSTNLIPLDTPVGQKLLSDQGKTIEDIKSGEKVEVKKTSNVLKIVLIVIGGSILMSVISSALETDAPKAPANMTAIQSKLEAYATEYLIEESEPDRWLEVTSTKNLDDIVIRVTVDAEVPVNNTATGIYCDKIEGIVRTHAPDHLRDTTAFISQYGEVVKTCAY